MKDNGLSLREAAAGRHFDGFVLDLMDRPGWLHRLAGFMGRGVLKA